MRSRVLLLLSAILLTASVHAADLAGSNVLVPVAGRTTGAFGSQWQTDLIVTNLDAEPVPLVLTFYGAGGERVFTTTSLWGRGTMVLEDVLFRAFRVSNATGMIRVSSSREGARVTARAYIVNRGASGGEYGQGVPAVPVDALATEHVLSGIAADHTRRTNLGVSNPWQVPASVTLTLHGPAGQQLGQLHRVVPALEVLQINDAFAAFGAEPVAEASVSVTSQVGVYAYASIIRNDTGDAIFVPGTGVSVQAASADVAPRCAEPVSLTSARKGQRASEGWIVIMKPDTTIDYMMNILPQQHGYELMGVYDELPGFAAELNANQLAALRCEASVLFIEQNVASE